jgi:hypothetical protein
MTIKQKRAATRSSLVVGSILFVASVAMSWGKHDSLLSSTLLWVGFVMVLFSAIVGAKGTDS